MSLHLLPILFLQLANYLFVILQLQINNSHANIQDECKSHTITIYYHKYVFFVYFFNGYWSPQLEH